MTQPLENMSEAWKSTGVTGGDTATVEPEDSDKSTSDSGEEFVEAIAPSPTTTKVLEETPFTPDKWREVARSGIAFGLLLLLSATVVLVLTATLFGRFTTQSAEAMFCALLSPLIGLVGAATGFYYGGRTQ